MKDFTKSTKTTAHGIDIIHGNAVRSAWFNKLSSYNILDKSLMNQVQSEKLIITLPLSIHEISFTEYRKLIVNYP